MKTEIIDGKAIAGEILSRLKISGTVKKYFAAVLVGDDAASASFVEQKKKTAESLGLDFRLYKFPREISQDNLRKEMGEIARHSSCGGVLLQLPMPEHINRHYVLNAIPREKDVDVLSERSLGSFYVRRGPVLPPVVGTVKEILEKVGFDLSDKTVAVVGLGLLIGRPIANWLMGKTRGLYLLGRGSDLSVLKMADLVIVGVGKSGLITPDMLKAGSGVIDFGYSVGTDGKLTGDFNPFSSDDDVFSGFYTPTPGGTGPILVAKLFENFYELVRAEGFEPPTSRV